MPTFFRLILALLTLALGVPALARQSSPLSNSPPSSAAASIMSVRFGFAGSGVMWPDHWAPIYVSLAGGAKPFAGTIRIKYDQNTGADTEISRPVACTPGKAISVPILISPPTECEALSVILADTRGRTIESQHFEKYSYPGSASLQLPELAGRSLAVVMGVGAFNAKLTSGARTITSAVDQVQNQSAFGSTAVSAVEVDAGQLPTSWAGYDGLLLLAVDADAFAAADPRVVPAIREWVTGGGRLVVFVNGPGEEWRQWLVAGVSPGDDLPVSVLPGAAEPTPDEASAWLDPAGLTFDGSQDAALRRLNQNRGLPGDWAPPVPVPPQEALPDPDAPPTPDAPAPPEAPIPLIEPAASITGRSIVLSPTGVRRGWTLRAPIGPAPQGVTDAPAALRGLLAEGPSGLGWITVVGFDPRTAARSASPVATRAAWKWITQNALADWRRGELNHATPQSQYAWNTPTPGSSMAHTGGLSEDAKLLAMNHLADVPIVGASVFLAMGAVLLGLVLLLGPVDALVLRRLHRRQHSWATALLWISVVSIVAYLVPSVLRGGPTRLNRLSVVDLLEPADGAGRPLAWRTAYTAVYAAGATRGRLHAPDAGQWWLGESSLSGAASRRSSRDAQTVRVSQLLPDLSSLAGDDFWGGMGVGGEGLGGTTLDSDVFRIWTFRTFSDRGRIASPARVRLAPPRGDGRRTLTVSGLPAGASVREAWVRIGARRFAVEFASAEGGDVSGSLVYRPIEAGAEAPSNPFSQDEAFMPGMSGLASYNSNRYGQQRIESAAALLHLRGPDRRGMVFETLSSRLTGDAPGGADAGTTPTRWGVVYLWIDGMPMDVSLGEETGPVTHTHAMFMRCLVPLAGTDVEGTVR